MKVTFCLLAALATAGPVSQQGPFQTASAQFTVGGLVGGGSQDAFIYYPRASSGSSRQPPYNVVSFGHGATSGGAKMDPSYHPLLTTLASYGFVVIAPLSCPDGFCPSKLATDLGAVLATCDADRSLHPALARANFTRVGAVGHSMGGTSAGYMAAANASARHNVRAYVGMHGTPISKEAGLDVPTLYTTGGADKIVFPEVVHSSFKASVGARPRVFAELDNATHFEPTDPSHGLAGGHLRLNPYVAQFLLCHVAGDQEGCGLVYDAADERSLCNAYAGNMQPPKGACDIVGM